MASMSEDDRAAAIVKAAEEWATARRIILDMPLMTAEAYDRLARAEGALAALFRSVRRCWRS